jgi:4-diphosphocytidyl-2-C-methyl-D-erythritol kinase
MIAFPNAKINLGLTILRKRDDGYHDIETMMIPSGPLDILEFHESARDKLEISGRLEPMEFEANLVGKAVKLVRKLRDIPPLEVYLHKAIPNGAGLGGGSSDAAYMLKMLNSHFGLGFAVNELLLMASQLGADCSFFIHNEPMLARGKGEVLETTGFKIPDLQLCLFYPGFPVSTAEAYAGITISGAGTSLPEILNEPQENWKDRLYNEFEKTVFSKYPAIKALKQRLYEYGAVYASMSGSGSSVYGLFTEEPVFDGNLQQMLVFSGKAAGNSFIQTN